MTCHRRLLLAEFDTADSYLSHPATYYHLGRESSRNGIVPEVRFGLLANQLPSDSEQEDFEPIATQIEEDGAEGAETQGCSARRAGTGPRGSSRHSSAAGPSSSGRR